MVSQKELRVRAQEEIEQIAHNLTSVSEITHHTKQDTEETIGLSWTNISDIYFSDTEQVSSINELKESLKNKYYLALISQKHNEPCLEVEFTREAHQRLEDK